MSGFLSKLEKGFEAIKEKLDHDDEQKPQQQQQQQQQQGSYGSGHVNSGSYYYNNNSGDYNQNNGQYNQQQSQYGQQNSQYSQPQSQYGQQQQGYNQQAPQYGSQAPPTIDYSSKPSNDNINGPFEVPFNGKIIPAERKSCRSGSKPLMLWTHGAGGGLNDDATQGFANGFAELAPIVVHEAQSNLENRVACYKAMTEHEGYATYIGGRSMGSRTAATLATSTPETKAVVLVSYPLFNNGECREQIMLDLPARLDVLFILGSKDPMSPCKKFEEVRARMKARSWVCIVQGAAHMMNMVHDHATKDMRRQSGRVAAEWLQNRDPSKTFSVIKMQEGKAVVFPWEHNETPSW
jgi:dienelactone hydrolase